MNTNFAGKTLLVVDDEEELRNLLGNIFSMSGAKVLKAENGIGAFQLLKTHKVDAVISDVRMPEADGVELLGWIRALDPKIPIVCLLTGFSDISPDEARAKGAIALLQKPFDIMHLMQIVNDALAGRTLPAT